MISFVASAEMSFENVDKWTTEVWLYYKLAYLQFDIIESKQKINMKKRAVL